MDASPLFIILKFFAYSPRIPLILVIPPEIELICCSSALCVALTLPTAAAAASDAFFAKVLSTGKALVIIPFVNIAVNPAKATVFCERNDARGPSTVLKKPINVLPKSERVAAN